jgi:hypothetical protein
MKSIYSFLCCFIFIGTSYVCSAQSDNGSPYRTQPTLEEKVTKSDLVIEGLVESVTGFRANKGNIYTSVIIRITKLFKGTVSDSIIEVIVDGGTADSILVMVSHGLILSTGMEGIFLLSPNQTEVKYAKEVKSFIPLYGERSYIGYHPEIYMVAHHVATCKGVTYDDLEKDLFEPIEAVTKTPRKVMGLNMFERKAAITQKDNK